MLSYFLTRWRLTRLFEPDEGGYLFRRSPTAEAVRVTPEERANIFRRFKSAYWKSHAVLWLCWFLGIVAALGIVVLVDAPESAAVAIGYSSAIILLIALLYLDKRVFDAAASAVAGHSAVKPARRWSQLRDERLEKATWWRLAWGGPFFGLIAWATFPSAATAGWVWILWIAYFGLFYGLWIYNIWRKLQLQRSR